MHKKTDNSFKIISFLSLYTCNACGYFAKEQLAYSFISDCNNPFKTFVLLFCKRLLNARHTNLQMHLLSLQT